MGRKNDEKKNLVIRKQIKPFDTVAKYINVYWRAHVLITKSSFLAHLRGLNLSRVKG